MKSFTLSAAVWVALFTISGCIVGPQVGDGGQAGAARVGLMTVTQSVTFDDAGQPHFSSMFEAAFRSAVSDAGVSAGSCQVTIEGSCTASQCFDVRPQKYSSLLVTGGDTGAGAISISGTLADGGLFVPPTGNGGSVHYALTAPGQLFVGGETLSFSGIGEDSGVPAFSNLAVTAPSVVTVLEPRCQQLNCGQINTSTPLTLRWDGGTRGTTTVVLSSSSGTKYGQVVCRFVAGPGDLTVSPNLLEVLHGQGSVQLSNTSSGRSQIGDFSVDLEVSSQFQIGAATF